MTTAVAFAIAFAIITVGGLGIAGSLLWLLNRDARQRRAAQRRVTHA